MRLPAVLASVPLLAGTAAGILSVGISPERFALASAAGAVFALLAAAGFLALRFDHGTVSALALGLACAGFANGTSTARSLEAAPLLRWFEAHDGDGSEPVTLVGRLREDAASTAQGVWLTLDALSVCAEASCRTGATPVTGGLRASVGGAVAPTAMSRWRAGRVVRLAVLLRTPATYRNPGVPNERRASARRGIVLAGSVKSAALVEMLTAGHPVAEAAARVRAWTRRVLSSFVAPHGARSAAVATAILIGDRTGLSEEDTRRLQDAGIYHVIAISGGNIAIFTALLLFVARACRFPPRAAALTTIGVLLFYAEVAGGAASVARAVSAAVVFLFALFLDHRGAVLNTVGVAAILGVSAIPTAVIDPGFLLSFAATAAIILGVPRLAPATGRTRHAARLGTATLCAEVALAPIAATFFSRVTAAGLVVNFAAIPLMTLVQTGSLAVLAASLVSDRWATALGYGVHWCAAALVESSRFVELAPWLARDVPAPSWWLCACYYAACLGCLASKTLRYAAMALSLALGCLILGWAPASGSRVPAPPPGVLRVVVFDVGQGDATAAILPDGTAILVDAGGIAGTSFDIAGRVVVPALRAVGVRALHALVLTHPDPDHLSGAPGVLRAFPLASIWEGVPVPPHPARGDLVARARDRGIVWRTVRPGDIDRAGDVEIRVLHPPAPAWERQRVRNDDSVVLELRYREVSIVLPGDIGREGELALVPSLQLAPTVVLKAPHHGSATSSGARFLDAARPSVAIFSAGRNNRFGHPAPAVVERYAARGVAMFNTATDGAVFVDTDGRRVKVWGWGSGRSHAIDDR